jgi:transposase
MGQRFVACDREQSFLMPPDVREWLPENHLAWFVIDAVGEMNLAGFYAAYRVDGRSRPAYDPAMMVALLLYAYARGVRSSRLIERCCEEDVAFRVLAAQERPDHATIARFIEPRQDAIAGLFGDVLALCAKHGLAKVGVIAVDGTKVPANASRDANRDYEQIARDILEEAKAVDAAEDDLYGDELPEQLRTGEGRRAWLREAKRRLAEQRAKEGSVPRSRPQRSWCASRARRPSRSQARRPCGRVTNRCGSSWTGTGSSRSPASAVDSSPSCSRSRARRCLASRSAWRRPSRVPSCSGNSSPRASP